MSAGLRRRHSAPGRRGRYDRGVSEQQSDQPVRLLVYSDDRRIRDKVMLALGRRPDRQLPPFEYLECATEPVVIAAMDAGNIDLAVLDGEAAPAGGMGIARQLKDEIFQCPPLVVLTGRAQDAWLATWSRADGVVPHPVDPMRLAEIVVELVRDRLAARPAVR